jgi:hypothetical protein
MRLAIALAAALWLCRAEAALEGQGGGQLYGSEEDGVYDYDKSRVESRITLTCEIPNSDKELEGLLMCIKYTRWPLVAQTVGSMVFDGVHKELQGKQFRPYAYGGNYWEQQHEYGTSNCISSDVDRYCRKKMVCKMVDALYGWLIDVPGAQEMVPLGSRYVKGWMGLKDLTVDRCADCQMAECDFPGCPQGTVVSSAVETKAKKVIRLPECGVACAPGTFLTCKLGLQCKYLPLTDVQAAAGASGQRAWYLANAVTRKVDVNVLNVDKLAPAPVGQCYPCRLAAGLTHYGAVASTDDALLSQGFLRFSCPGGDAAPMRCAANQVTKFDVASGASSECGCQSGYYLNSSLGRCAPCPAGFLCAWEGMSPPTPRECPADEYSTGYAAACTPCDMGLQCENGQAPTRCRRSQGGEAKGIYQRGNAQCVDCTRCQQLQAAGATGGVPCYRVSPKIF